MVEKEEEKQVEAFVDTDLTPDISPILLFINF